MTETATGKAPDSSRWYVDCIIKCTVIRGAERRVLITCESSCITGIQVVQFTPHPLHCSAATCPPCICEFYNELPASAPQFYVQFGSRRFPGPLRSDPPQLLDSRALGSLRWRFRPSSPPTGSRLANRWPKTKPCRQLHTPSRSISTTAYVSSQAPVLFLVDYFYEI